VEPEILVPSLKGLDRRDLEKNNCKTTTTAVVLLNSNERHMKQRFSEENSVKKPLLVVFNWEFVAAR